MRKETMMSNEINRRGFLKKGAAAGAAASLAMSLEEKALMANPAEAGKPPANDSIKGMPMGKIGNVNISRLICGGNLISGYAHSRDLIYVSSLLKNYFTDNKIMETWQISEENGINSMIAYPEDPHAIKVYREYCKKGGKIQWLAQLSPKENDIKGAVDRAMEIGAAGMFLLGNLGDLWARKGRLDLIENLLDYIKKQGIIAGVAGHSLDTVIAVETAGLEPDFYMKTLHSNNYWSKRKPDQTKAVIDNYATDNYWDMYPEETIDFMAEVKRPWIAYKVLAAGALHPKEGFDFAFKNGADFACVGMFDFQIREDVMIAKDIIARNQKRKRNWQA